MNLRLKECSNEQAEQILLIRKVFNIESDKLDIFEVDLVISSLYGFGFKVKMQNGFNACKIYMKPSVKGIVITMMDVRDNVTTELVFSMNLEELKEYIVDFIVQNELECRGISW